MARYIFVTGGVVSSLGKGLSSASLAYLLKNYDYTGRTFMKRIKHSKVKNTGLIFELLVRQVASDTMNNKDSKALRILKKHYHAKSELTKELKLYRTVAQEKFLTKWFICLIIKLKIFSLKSNSIAHGVTNVTETDTYAFMAKAAPNDGGLRFYGLADTGTKGLAIIGLSPSDDATRSTSAPGVVEIAAVKKNGTKPDDRDANKNIVVFKNRNDTRFIWNSDGDFYADVNSHTFDHYNDAQLARTFDISHGRGVIESKFDKFVQYNHEKLAELKLVGRDEDGTPNSMLNVTGLQRLHNGAIWQQYEKHNQLLDAVYDLAKEAVGEEKANAILDKHEVKRLQ